MEYDVGEGLMNSDHPLMVAPALNSGPGSHLFAHYHKDPRISSPQLVREKLLFLFDELKISKSFFEVPDPSVLRGLFFIDSPRN